MIYGYSIFDPRKQNLPDKIKNLKNKEALLQKNQTKKSKKRIKHEYKVGDVILKKLHHLPKIIDKWSGSYEITKIINSDTFIINESNEFSRVNIKNIEPLGRAEDVVHHNMDY
ncbi:hypothetical protein DMUE_3273 [Dictyocoela muelleri]|nr:hypothetical protein DMUE_3273 [Dictyocoela muelleri]